MFDMDSNYKYNIAQYKMQKKAAGNKGKLQTRNYFNLICNRDLRK